MELACPRCRGSLEPGRQAVRCSPCGEAFRTLRGIPDLRTADDEYLPNADDWRIAERLSDEYDRCDFLGLLDVYYDLVGDVLPAARARQVAHILSAPARSGAWIEALGHRVGSGVCLDLGCGPGSFLASRPREGAEWWGLDIAMRWLILARKRLDEAGRPDVRLVCGCAESLPFADRSFRAIVAGDVVEHVRDRRATLAEAHRVLEPGGRMIAPTPNRFSLAPEPHVDVWGVGFLPRRLMQSYVRMMGGGDFRAIHTMGAWGWAQLAASGPFGGCQVRVPELPRKAVEGFRPAKRRLARLYNGLVRTPPGRVAALAFGPLFHLVFERRGELSPRSTRAIQRRSRPSAARA